MVTGPMPRKPKATRPKANTAGASISAPRPKRADVVADGHQQHHGEAQPVGAEVAGHEAREDVERSAAFLATRSRLPARGAIRRGEDLHQLRDDRAGQRAAGDDGRQLPPQRWIAAQRRDDQVRHDVGQRRWRRSRSATPARSAALRSSSCRRCRSAPWRWPR